MFKGPQNGKPGHTTLLLKPFDSYRIVAIYKQTNKQTRTIKYVCDTGYMYKDLSFPVYILKEI